MKILLIFLHLYFVSGVELMDFKLQTDSDIFYPIDNFEERVKFKKFGTFVTPENSPVEPERFYGFHAGIDFEIFPEEEVRDIFIYSIADGEVALVRNVNGYGGVVVIYHQIEGKDYTALYGHLDLKSVNFSVGDRVFGGDKIAVLGDGYTTETSGERKHLHFSVVEGREIVLAGYVNSEDQLRKWIDPMVLFD